MKLLLIFTFFFISFGLTNSYNNELVFNDEGKTIRELKENLEKLDKEKEDIINEFKEVISIDKFKTYFKDEISNEEKEELREIIKKYNIKRKLYESELHEKAKKLEKTNEIKKILLETKKELYKSLVPYIKSSKVNNYLEYIKSDTEFYSERKELDTNIIRKKEIIINKVNVLEEKIKKHNSFLEDRFKLIVEEKLSQKIKLISENEKFVKLTDEQKIKVIEKTIKKINERLKLSFSNNDDLKNISEQKIQIYKITINKLTEFKDNFADKKEETK